MDIQDEKIDGKTTKLYIVKPNNQMPYYDRVFWLYLYDAFPNYDLIENIEDCDYFCFECGRMPDEEKFKAAYRPTEYKSKNELLIMAIEKGKKLWAITYDWHEPLVDKGFANILPREVNYSEIELR